MPKYLWQVNFTASGVQGLLKEGGTSRHEYIKGFVESLGGTLEVSASSEHVSIHGRLPRTPAATSIPPAAVGASR